MLKELVFIFDIITILLTVYWCVKNLKNLNSSSRFIIYYVFVFVYAFPLVLDYSLGLPNYSNWYNASVKYAGFINSYNDPSVRVLYDIFLILTQWILLNVGRTINFKLGPFTTSDNNNEANKSKYFDGVISQRLALTCITTASIAPVLCVIMGYPYIMAMWGWRDLQVFSNVTSSAYYSTIEKITYISVVLLLCLIMTKEINNTSILGKMLIKFIALVLLMANLCIESKRSILFFCVIIVLVIKIYGWGKNFNLGRYILLCLVGVSIILIYSIYVKTALRGYSSFSDVYTNLRVDMFRDDTVKLVIKALIDPSIKPILDYPFQSYLTQIPFIFPLDFIIGMLHLRIPGVGFNTYLTSALSGSSIESGDRWMTTSISDEVIANFGFLGYIILPMVILSSTKKIDRMEGITQVFWIGGLVLMMMYSLNYIIYYLEFAIVLKWISGLGQRNYIF